MVHCGAPSPALSSMGRMSLVSRDIRVQALPRSCAGPIPLGREAQYRIPPRFVAVLVSRTGDVPVPEKDLAATNVTTHIDVSTNQPR